MTEPLYSIDILRLAVETGLSPRLDMPDASVENRSQLCGSRIVVDVAVDTMGHVIRYGHDVKACALGQASAALLARHVAGRTLDELSAARDALADYLAATSTLLPEWPDIDLLAKARPYPARHAAIRLPFEAVVDAVARALGAPVAVR